LVVVVAIVAYFVVWPSPIDPVPLDLPPLPKLEGPTAPNTLLQSAETLFSDIIKGPESIAFDKEGRMYFGLGDGRIVRTKETNPEKYPTSELETVARTGKDLPECGAEEFEHGKARISSLAVKTENLLGLLFFWAEKIGLFFFFARVRTSIGNQVRQGRQLDCGRCILWPSSR
jgi:hypothetical protein